MAARAIFLAALLVSTAALASPRVEPPRRFDHPATVKVVVVPRTLAEINSICRDHPWVKAGSCTLPGSTCVIMWPRGKARSGILWRHEIAHCNGWPSSHPR